MPKAPKKNISSTLHEVKWPKNGIPISSELAPIPKPPQKPRSDFKWPLAAFVIVVLIFGTLLTFSRGGEKKEENQNVIGADLKDVFSKSFGLFRSIKNLSSNSFRLMDKVAEAQALMPKVLNGERGDELIALLKETKVNVDQLSLEIEKLQEDENTSLLNFTGQNPVALGVALDRMSGFLGAFIPWLEGEKRVVLLFQNPSELRPTGGFIGSLAELNIKGGSVSEIKVYDINEIDRELELKIAPPEPLTALGTRWYTRDANWFFNYPDSAKNIYRFMESSRVYSAQNKKIDAVISLSGKVIEDVLQTTGPIELPNGTILNSENFLREIQKDVQENRASSESQPKKILKDALPIIIDRLAEIDSVERKIISERIGEWMSEKDIMLNFKDHDLQKFFEAQGWAGSVYSLPRNFDGDYLAIVSSNMASGKSDLVIERKTVLTSQIGLDGTVTNELVIIRKHNGNKESAWWYDMTNDSFFKIFVPRSSALESLSGAFSKKTQSTTLDKSAEASLIEETKETILTIPEVALYEENGKRAISFWSKLLSGQEKEIKLNYKHKLFAAPAEGEIYQFIFEKQAGTKGEYEFHFIAPVGYVFKNNGLATYEYKTNDPPGRLILELVFEKAF